MRYFEKSFHVFILSTMIGFFTGVAYADLNKSNLGISTWSSDTTLRGFSNSEDERFKNLQKEEMLAFEKEHHIKLFSIVKDETRYGKTAFFVQAPGYGCYNKQTGDCNRKNGETQKHVEAHYSAFDGDEYWFSVSIK